MGWGFGVLFSCRMIKDVQSSILRANLKYAAKFEDKVLETSEVISTVKFILHQGA